MIPYIIGIFMLVSPIHGEPNITMENETVTQQWACRTERKVYVLSEDFSADTCARCYLYMPLFSFKRKFKYLSSLSLLQDPATNFTYNADPLNTSLDLSASFNLDSHVLKWKQCCLAAMECCERMLTTPPIQTDGAYCPRTWDGWQCWDDTPGGKTAKNHCEAHVYFDNEPPSCPKYAYKRCWPNGTWFQNKFMKEWTNYTKCGRMDEHRNHLYFHIGTYCISVASLVPSIIIFSVYEQLKVQRPTMHKNFFLSICLHGFVAILFKSIVIVDQLKKTATYETIMDRNGSVCKIILILTKYFRMTNYMWMFCEAFFLHKLIATVFAVQDNLYMFYIIGWVMPIIPVSVYAILRKTTEDDNCWAFPVESYEWIMNAPNMTSLLVNLMFLFNIMRILLTKLRKRHSNELIQYRKAVRATLVLAPLFGLQFLLIIYRPPLSTQCDVLTAYTYFSHAMDGLQGLMVSLPFCYMNDEIQHLLRRTYESFRRNRQLSPAARMRNSTCDFPMVTIKTHRDQHERQSHLSPQLVHQ